MHEERIFNYRLYHLVYHWAAYTATLVLLLSLGALVAVTPPANRHASYLYFANVAGACASWFFLYRMKTFGDQVHMLMGGLDEKTQGFLKHPCNLWFGAAVTLIIVGFNLTLVWRG